MSREIEVALSDAGTISIQSDGHTRSIEDLAQLYDWAHNHLTLTRRENERLGIVAGLLAGSYLRASGQTVSTGNAFRCMDQHDFRFGSKERNDQIQHGIEIGVDAVRRDATIPEVRELFEDTPVNALRETFDASQVCECRGVQFVVLPTQASVASGSTLYVMVYAQNCIDAPRELTISLSRQRMATLRPSWFTRVTSATWALSPGASGQFPIPVTIEPEMSGLYVWKAVPRVTGRRGKRLVRWSPPKYRGGLITLALTALGLIARRDEPRFEVRVLGTARTNL